VSCGIHQKKVWTRNGKHFIKRKWQWSFACKRAIRIVKKCEHEYGNTTSFPAEVVQLALANKVGLTAEITAICSLLNPRYWHCLVYSTSSCKITILHKQSTLLPVFIIKYLLSPARVCYYVITFQPSGNKRDICTFQMSFLNRNQLKC